MTSTHSSTATATLTPSAPVLRAPVGVKRLVLTGFMGAGKSTIGRLLAKSLGWKFLDLDNHLEQRTGSTIADIFTHHGEARFRRLESTALASALTHNQTVIALGGGTPESLTNHLLIEQTPGTFTIFLDAPFPTLFDRCVLQATTRPVLADPEAARSRFSHRRPLYLRLAGLTIDTTNLTPEETVTALLTALNKK